MFVEGFGQIVDEEGPAHHEEFSVFDELVKESFQCSSLVLIEVEREFLYIVQLQTASPVGVQDAEEGLSSTQHGVTLRVGGLCVHFAVGGHCTRVLFYTLMLDFF